MISQDVLSISHGKQASRPAPMEPRQAVFGHVVAKVVEKEERIEFASIAKTECAAQVDPRAFYGWLGQGQPLHWTK